MRPTNGRLIALVAAVAVAAIALGGALAYSEGPQDAAAEAAPLTGAPSPAAAPSTTTTPVPIGTPAPKQSSAPPTSSGPSKVVVNVAKLDKGREPQIPYLVGREVRGGAGDPTKIPGTGGILAIGRLDPGVLAIVAQGDGTELLNIRNDQITRTPGVTSLVTTADQSAAAYAAARISSLGGAKQGGTVFAEKAGTGGSVQSLKLPDSWNLQVLAYVDAKVYYRADDDNAGVQWSLYSWVPGTAKPTLIRTVSSPSAVSDDGQVAAAVNLINDSGSCSSLSEVSSGKKLARTCDYMITGFTPDGATAVGGPAYGDGYCNLVQAAVDTKTGRLVREWKGCFHQIVAEDDQHVLIVAVAEGGGGDPGTKSAIIRCSLATSACERATAISTDKQLALAE